MTRNKAHHAVAYAFRRGEQILVDANVWLYLQPPAAQPCPYWAARYTTAFSNLLKAEAQPVVEALVISEYINRYLRLEYDAMWRQTYPEFKRFRESGDFTALAQAAVAEARQILRQASSHDTPLKNADLAGILNETEAGRLDFNDGMLIETCRAYGWKLLTNDGDMIRGGIDVITTNSKLLKACP